MTQHNLNGHVIGVVEVPADAQNFKIEHSYLGNSIEWYPRDGHSWYAPLLPGSWSILGRPKEITEEGWKGLVDIQEVGYYDYEDVYCVGYFITALESGLSWCRANNIDLENCLLIIKNKEV